MTTETDVPRGTTASADISPGELQLAARNHGMPLEALRRDITPIGLHYLLIHFDIPFIDETSWRLRIEGVDRVVELSLQDLQSRPRITAPVTLECAGNGRTMLSPRAVSQPWMLEAVGTGEWTGTPLRPLLEEAGVGGDATTVVFTGMDRGVEAGTEEAYERGLDLAEALRDDLMIAYALNGQPLPPQHGFPARLLVPGWYGMASVKWLERITVTNEPYTGYQNVRAYRMRQHHDDEGVPLSRIAVRSLMVPPGVPDFATRVRQVGRGPCEIVGRAWSGSGPIVRVEVSDDLGSTWSQATVDDPVATHAWQRWQHTWQPAGAGETQLWCRATDASGATQPIDPVWNLGGYGANAVQRVPVVVHD